MVPLGGIRNVYQILSTILLGRFFTRSDLPCFRDIVGGADEFMRVASATADSRRGGSRPPSRSNAGSGGPTALGSGCGLRSCATALLIVRGASAILSIRIL